MFDGAELGQAIAAHPGDSEAALTAYEAAMFPRSESFAADAHEILELCLGDRARGLPCRALRRVSRCGRWRRC